MWNTRPILQRRGKLVVVEGAGARAARVAARSAWSCGARHARTRSLRGDRERRELPREPLALALRALRLLVAVDQRFEGMGALFADVFENWHRSLRVRGTKPHLYLKSKCGRHANRI